jgi:hypothetical protein
VLLGDLRPTLPELFFYYSLTPTNGEEVLLSPWSEQKFQEKLLETAVLMKKRSFPMCSPLSPSGFP